MADPHDSERILVWVKDRAGNELVVPQNELMAPDDLTEDELSYCLDDGTL